MKPAIFLIFFISLFNCSPAQSIILDWAKAVGGSSNSGGIKTVSDAVGNVYVMGYFFGTIDIDPGPAVFNITSSGEYDIFVTKSDAAGNFLWVKQIGGPFYDNFRSMNIDNSGNLYFTGSYYATLDFDPGPAVFNMTCSTTGYATFLLKLNAGGNFIWVREIIEAEYSSAGGNVAATPSGDVYVSGYFQGTGDFDPGPGVFTLSSTGTVSDVFISKFDVNGNFIWVKQIAGFDGKNCYSMSLDAFDNVYLTGVFYYTCDFDPGPAVFNLTANNTSGSSATYILKLDRDGQFVFAKQIAADFNIVGHSIIVGQTGAIFVTGDFTGNGDFDPGPGTFTMSAGVYPHAFIVKLDNTGNFGWAKQFVSGALPTSGSYGLSISVDNFGNVYSVGGFNGAVDFDPSASTFTLSSPARGDTYISKLDPDGNFLFGLQLTGNDLTYSGCLFVDAQRNLTLTGSYVGTSDFDPTAGVYSLSSNGGDNTFYLKLKQPCAQSTSYNINVSTCNTYTLNSQVYGSSGTYTQTLINAAGCDSIITLNLTIGGSTNMLSVTSCNSYLWEGQDYTSSGNYSVTYLDAGGCDSVLNLNLVIKNSIASNITASICEGQTSNGYAATGIYTDTFTAANGCDSTRTLNLTVRLKSIVSLNKSICEGQTFDGYSVSGMYTNRFVAANGCDSIRTLNLIVNPKKMTTVNVGICNGQTYVAAGAAQATSGIYRDTLRTFLNCDSIIITNLIVYPKPTPDLGQDKNVCAGSVAVLNPGTYKSYAWQDMSTLPTYGANAIGLYWVTVTDHNNCIATDSFRINSILPLPANFLKPSDSICPYEKLVLKPTKNYSTYLWSNGAAQRNITIQNAGQYLLQVTDVNGCKGLDTINVISKTCKTGVYIPTAFSPNRDGKNDFFKATVYGHLLSFKIEVFNRYGELVFLSTDPQKGWDGLYKGAPISTSSFVWQCAYQLEGNQPVYQKGSVVLIR